MLRGNKCGGDAEDRHYIGALGTDCSSSLVTSSVDWLLNLTPQSLSAGAFGPLGEVSPMDHVSDRKMIRADAVICPVNPLENEDLEHADQQIQKATDLSVIAGISRIDLGSYSPGFVDNKDLKRLP